MLMEASFARPEIVSKVWHACSAEHLEQTIYELFTITAQHGAEPAASISGPPANEAERPVTDHVDTEPPFMSISRKAFLSSAFVAAATLLAPATASAQDLISFLWGGDQEHGGGRKTVSFPTSHKPGQVIVSFGDRRLYHVIKPGQATSYPIAVPREQSRWEGTTSVSMKRENPPWTPTPTMRAENPRLPSYVPGGHPLNPLGVRALYLGSSTYRIHGTDAPWTIGQAVSKGCIRMYNEDVMDLYPRIPVGTRVVVTWQRFNSEQIAAAEPETNRLTDAAQRAAQRRARYEARAFRNVSRSRSASIN